MPQKLVELGKILPSAIMAVLIVYCLKDAGSDWMGVGIPKLIAVAVVAASYKWKHNTFLSILAGTACYMVLYHMA
jgi:branched-subunit amino acid transport protein AzlD